MQTRDKRRHTGCQKHRHFKKNFSRGKSIPDKNVHKTKKKAKQHRIKPPGKTWKSLAYNRKHKATSLSKIRDLRRGPTLTNTVSKQSIETLNQEQWVEVESVGAPNKSWCSIS